MIVTAAGGFILEVVDVEERGQLQGNKSGSLLTTPSVPFFPSLFSFAYMDWRWLDWVAIAW